MYEVGGFDFPTSTGSHLIPVEFEPQGAVFMGGNQSAVDTLINPANAGAFFGMAWYDHATGLLDQQANAVAAYDQYWFRPSAIGMVGSGGSTDYRADVTLTPDGILLNVLTAAPGVRPIHYIAWGEHDNHGGTSQGNFDTTVFDLDFDYRPTTGLMFHFWPLGAIRDLAGTGGSFHSMGMGNWPSADMVEELGGTYGPNTHAGASAIRVFSAMGSVGYTSQWNDHFGATGTSPSIRPWVAGSYLSAIDHLGPQPNWSGGDGTGIHVELWGYTTRHSIAWWTGEGYVRYVNGPNVDAQHVYPVSANVEEIEAVLFWGTTGYSSEQILNPNVGYIFGVLGPDYQGVVSYDLGIGDSHPTGVPAFYQSRSHCYVENLCTGLRTASGEIEDPNVILTGLTALAGSAGNSFMQVWGDVKDNPTAHQRRRYVSMREASA